MPMLERSVLIVCVGVAGQLAAMGCGSNGKSTASVVNPGRGSGGSSAGEAGEKRIIIITNGDSPFWTAARVGLQEAETELNLAKSGLRASLEINNSSPQGQIDLLRQYASQSDIVGIGISPVVADNVARLKEISGLDEVSFHMSGTEAVMQAVRLARYHTGRSHAVRFWSQRFGVRAKNIGCATFTPEHRGPPGQAVLRERGEGPVARPFPLRILD